MELHKLNWISFLRKIPTRRLPSGEDRQIHLLEESQKLEKINKELENLPVIADPKFTKLNFLDMSGDDALNFEFKLTEHFFCLKPNRVYFNKGLYFDYEDVKILIAKFMLSSGVNPLELAHYDSLLRVNQQLISHGVEFLEFKNLNYDEWNSRKIGRFERLSLFDFYVLDSVTTRSIDWNTTITDDWFSELYLRLIFRNSESIGPKDYVNLTYLDMLKAINLGHIDGLDTVEPVTLLSLLEKVVELVKKNILLENINLIEKNYTFIYDIEKEKNK